MKNIREIERLKKKCAYCGIRDATDKEHVFPKCLYPKSKADSRVQRLTIPSCNICNNGWSDDEAHFRNVLTIADGNSNCQKELWHAKVHSSFQKNDGKRRVLDIYKSLCPVEIDGQQRHMIYPAKDASVIRVMNKVVKGLSHHHSIQSALPDSRIWIDILKYQIPNKFINEMTYAHREQEIVQYYYSKIQEEGIQSAWFITFFNRISFIGIVSSTENGLF